VQACEDAIVLRGGSAVAALPAHEMSGEAGAGAYRALLD
jgi:ABC-2 type transport system ATP-binding protein